MNQPSDGEALEQVMNLVDSLYDEGFTPELCREIGASKELRRAMYDAVVNHDVYLKKKWVHGHFRHLHEQVAEMYALSLQRRWGFSDEAFTEAGRSLPEWPEDENILISLVPYLPDLVSGSEVLLGGFQRTFDELQGCLQPNLSKRASNACLIDSRQVFPIKGSTYTPGLRWEVIDTTCQRGEMPTKVRSVASSPHLGLLAAAVLHPRWAQRLDGEQAPYIWIPGCEYGVGKSRQMLYLYWATGDKVLRMRVDETSASGPNIAVPRFYQAPPKVSP